MSNIVKLETLNFPRLNNAEFTYFAGQIISYIDAATVEALHVDAATFAGFKGNQPWRRFTWTLPLLRASRATTGSWWTS